MTYTFMPLCNVTIHQKLKVLMVIYPLIHPNSTSVAVFTNTFFNISHFMFCLITHSVKRNRHTSFYFLLTVSLKKLD